MTTILIVDDDNELTELLDEFLSEHKFKTKVFHSTIADGVFFVVCIVVCGCHHAIANLTDKSLKKAVPRGCG